MLIISLNIYHFLYTCSLALEQMYPASETDSLNYVFYVHVGLVVCFN